MDELKHYEAPIRILLGGGIASGKSAVGRRFDDFGAKVIDADLHGHLVLEPDGEACGSVSERWPWVLVDHRIDRRALAEIVFADPEQLTELEALTHPAIIRRISGLVSTGDDVVVEIPLILDVPGAWTKVFVDADDGSRLERAVKRGSTEADVRQRMANQPSRDEWITWADVIVDNNGSVEDLERQLDSLWYGLRTTDYGLHLPNDGLHPPDHGLRS